MKAKTKEKRSPSCLSCSLVLLAVIALMLFLAVNLYRPDVAIPTIVPGSSSEPSFSVQIIRPREGLPLGGLLPPQFFGVDAELGFDSKSEDARHTLKSSRLELCGDDWELRLIFDQNGQISSESEIVFNLVFEDRVRRVRCKPSDPTTGELTMIELEDSKEFSGSFDLELSICEDAETGLSLGWPPKPFVLRGSFDRLLLGDHPD